MSQSFLEEIDELIRARYTMLYVVTWEEKRAQHLLYSVAEKQQKALFDWSITQGLRKISGPNDFVESGNKMRKPLEVLNHILQTSGETIFILKDFHHFWDSPEVIRQIESGDDNN